MLVSTRKQSPAPPVLTVASVYDPLGDIPPDLREYLTAELVALLATLPRRVDDKAGAEIITRHLYRVSHRTLERYPVPARTIGGRRHRDTAWLIAEAARRVAEAPAVMPAQARTTTNTQT